MNNNLPNFLIVGAAKCGTSSLHQYLEQHPEIFMSKVKEPRYISSQVNKLPLGGPKDHTVEKWYVKNKVDYEELFKGVSSEKMIGESSADTFYFHERTIPFIKSFLGDPKILILLRNPVKRAFSAYQHLRRDDRENLTFEEGLNAEQKRIENNFELIYHYKDVSLYADGIKAFKENFSNVKVVITEELQSNPLEVLNDIFRFLNVEEDVSIDTSQIHNMSGIPRSRWLHELLFEGKRIIIYLRPFVRFFLNKSRRDRISRNIQQKNLKRLSLPKEASEKLYRFFEEDIKATEQLLGRNLDLWRIK